MVAFEAAALGIHRPRRAGRGGHGSRDLREQIIERADLAEEVLDLHL
jgi:hypothetical protein